MTSSQNDPESPRRKKRWWQYSLFTLVMVMLVLSVPLGWIGMKYQEERREEIAHFQSKRSTAHIVDATEEKIYYALNDDTRLEFIETPLVDVISFLKDQHDIPIEIDTTALKDAGVKPDTPITVNLKGITLASGLRLMLPDLGLTYAVRDEVLCITTVEQSGNRVRIYNVAHVLKDERSAETLAEALQRVLTDRAESVQVSAYRKLLIVRASPAKHDELGTLIPLLRKGVKYENPPAE